MDELETRISALETLFIEIGPFLEPAALADAARSIRDGLAGSIGEDEAHARRQALDLIELAQKRYSPPLNGVVLRPRP